MQRPGTEVIRTQIQHSKPKREINKITNNQNILTSRKNASSCCITCAMNITHTLNRTFSYFLCLSRVIEYQNIGSDANFDEKLCGSTILENMPCTQGTDGAFGDLGRRAIYFQGAGGHCLFILGELGCKHILLGI